MNCTPAAQGYGVQECDATKMQWKNKCLYYTKIKNPAICEALWELTGSNRRPSACKAIIRLINGRRLYSKSSLSMKEAQPF